MTTFVTRCSTTSRELAESPAATAAVARTWLLLEQPGPWGAKALDSSHLDAEVGRGLERAANTTGVRVALIRRSGRHTDGRRQRRRKVFSAHTAPGRGWLREAEIEDPAELLDLDFTRLGDGEHDGLGSTYRGEPLAAVCTNGRRDRCCALLGRPLAADLASIGLHQVWEVTHLGGHRFSPTMLVLPYGYAYARQDPASAKAVLEAARNGRMVVDGCRGRSTWERPGQAAELAVRRLTGEDRAESVLVRSCEASDHGWTLRVAHTDGRVWTVDVEPSSLEPPRPESCAGAPGNPSAMTVRSVVPIVSSAPTGSPSSADFGSTE